MHVPLRTCVGCRTVRPQAELLRAVVIDGQVLPDRADRRGRSAYVCPSRPCLDQAARRGGFARAFAGAPDRTIDRAERRRAGKFTVDADRLWSAFRADLGARIELHTRSGRSAALPRVQRLAALAVAMDAPAGRIS